MKLHSLYILILLTLFGCEKILIPENDISNKEIFNSIWNNYDLHYAYFNEKKINWDSIYTTFDAKITNDLDDDQLFDLLAEMLSNLKDPHVWLETDKRFYSYQKPEYIFYYNRNIINTYLLSPNKNKIFTHGMLENNIGYIHISTFYNNIAGYNYIDDILEAFKNCNGIIIDVRSNTGGSDIMAGLIASRFYDQPRNYSYFQTRNEPDHSDFSEIKYCSLSPAGNNKPDIPLVLLTDQSVASAGEDFTLMLRVLPQVTVVGDYTGARPGGIPRPKELQNGWIHYTPTGLQFTMDDELFVNIGMEPDIYVIEQQSGRDLMIEKGIDILK